MPTEIDNRMGIRAGSVSVAWTERREIAIGWYLCHGCDLKTPPPTEADMLRFGRHGTMWPWSDYRPLGWTRLDGLDKHRYYCPSCTQRVLAATAPPRVTDLTAEELRIITKLRDETRDGNVANWGSEHDQAVANQAKAVALLDKLLATKEVDARELEVAKATGRMHPADVNSALGIAYQRCLKLIEDSEKRGDTFGALAWRGALNAIDSAERVMRDARTKQTW